MFEHRKDLFGAGVVVGGDDHKTFATGLQRAKQRLGLRANRVLLGRDGVKHGDAVVVKGNGVTGFDFFNAHTRRAGVGVQFGRANVEHPIRRFTERQHTGFGRFAADEVGGAEFGVAVADALVDGARDLAAFHMSRADVAHGADDAGGQGLDPVAVDDDQVWPVFMHKVGEAEDGLAQDEIQRIAFALVHKLKKLRPGKAFHFQAGFTVALHHVHAGDEEADVKASVLRRFGQGL